MIVRLFFMPPPFGDEGKEGAKGGTSALGEEKAARLMAFGGRKLPSAVEFFSFLFLDTCR